MKSHFKDTIISGTEVNYYFICHRKLWLFSHGIQMEQESDLVSLGKFIHERSYRRKKEDIRLNGIKIDFIENGKALIVHEVKKSQKMERAHEFQLLYYLYYLRKMGVDAEGILNYPLQRQSVKVSLTPEKIAELEAAINEIKRIIQEKTPPQATKQPICRRCSYYEFCWS
ncbi:MAG: CRISPR-associated protein Cas4 [Candidatus Micrarchaeia archaeon]